MPQKGLLRKIDLNITNDCNIRCNHCCFSSGETNLNHLSFAEITRFLTEAKEMGASRIDITGGEALTRPDIFDIIDYAKKLGYRIELLSNGILLTPENIARLKSIGLDAVGVSVESLNTEMNRTIRGFGAETLAQIFINIQNCVKAGFYTKVNSVVFKTNYKGFKDLALWCSKNGIVEYGIYYFTPIGRGAAFANQVLPVNEWLNYVQTELYPIRDKIKISIETAYMPQQTAALLDVSCFIKRPHHIQILPSGNIFPCAIMSVWNIALGNIKTESIKDIWLDDLRWQKYNTQIDHLFSQYGGCVDYSACNFDTQNLSFVCPCSKYSSTEISGK